MNNVGFKIKIKVKVNELMICLVENTHVLMKKYLILVNTPRQKSIRALEIFRVQKLILNATS